MFNAEKLLGGMVQEALSSSLGVSSRSRRRSRRRDTSFERAIGMGLIGLAVGAFEHFTRNNQHAATTTPTQPQPARSVPPPTAPAAVPPPPPPPIGTVSAPAAPAAVILLRAMFAAAAADGSIDENERTRILERASQGGLTPEEKSFLEREMAQPCTLFQLLEEVERAKADSELREQVYLAASIAVKADSDAERDFFQGLAEGLGLSEAQVKKVSSQAGIEQ